DSERVVQGSREGEERTAKISAPGQDARKSSCPVLRGVKSALRRVPLRPATSGFAMFFPKETEMPNMPRQGTAFVDFARRVVDILLTNPWGVDQDLFLYDYYSGNPPSDLATRDFEWEEFKRGREYSDQMFKNGVDGWVWVRARHGILPHQFLYQAVAIIAGGEPEMVIRYPVSEALLIDKTGDWKTRT